MPHELQAVTACPGVGGFWLVAHWVGAVQPEQQADLDWLGPGHGGTVWAHSVEYAWLFVQPPDLADDDWALAVQLMAEAHDQPAFILRAGDGQVARLFGRDGVPWASLPSADAILAAARVLTFLRSRGGTWGHADYDRLALLAPGAAPAFAGPSRYAVRPAADAPAVVGAGAVTFYAAVPQCNSARMLFAHLRARHGA